MAHTLYRKDFRPLFYTLVILIFIAYVASHAPAQNVSPNASPQTSPQISPASKPAFSLSTNRTFSTTDRARFSINYYNLDYLDFRVYHINEPEKFFRSLRNPHQMGERDESVTREFRQRQNQKTFLERVRDFKDSIYLPVRNYFRSQLQRKSREVFNRKFRAPREDDSVKLRVPLNVADFARLPLLNANQLASSWREKLTPLENEYDRRVLSLGSKEAGVYLVEAVHADLRAYTILVISDLTLIKKAEREGELMVYAVNRKTGEPRPDVQIQVSVKQQILLDATTDRNGMLRSNVKRPQPEKSADESEDEDDYGTRDDYLIMARDAKDFAISDLETYALGLYSGEETGDAQRENLVGYIYTDRPVYRPNQKIYFKGILRRRTDDGYQLLKANSVNVTIGDSQGTTIFERALPLNSRGTFSGEVETTEDAPLGGYSLRAKINNSTASGYFEVQEYKKPEYKVTVRAADKFVVVNSKTKFTVEARYFFGAPVTRANVKYYVYRSRYYHWRGDDEEDDDFGVTYEDENADDYDSYGGYGDDMVSEGEGVLNKDGRLEIPFTVPATDAKQPFDFTYRLEAQVTDAARRANEGKASFIGTRGTITASAEAERYVYARGDIARIHIRTSDYENRPRAASLKLQFVKETWEAEETGDEKYPKYTLREKLLSTADVQTNEQGEVFYNYQIPVVGNITIKAIINENNRDIVTTSGSLWATEDSGEWAMEDYQANNSIKLIFDKKSYRPGDTARVLALLPTDGTSHLFVTTELESVLSARHIVAKGRAAMFEIPVEARFAPNVFVSVAYVQEGEMYNQDRSLIVPARDKILKVEVVPNKEIYRPRDVASYTVLVRNDDGTPAANAEVSLGVVDEAVYEIRGESAGDIRETFYGRRYNEVSTSFAVDYYFTGYSGREAMQLARNRKREEFKGFADVKNDSQYAEAVIRKIFKDTAAWQPNAVTDGNGRAIVGVELPDNLTTWRATARAVTSDLKVGASVTKTLARKDLILRVAMPRFLTEGDTVTISGIVHNYLKTEKQTKISLEVTGGELQGQSVQVVQIPSQGEHRLDFRIHAARAGNITLLAKALTDTESDAVELPLEVIPKGLQQTRGGALTIFDETAERGFTLDVPANANTEARTLRIEAAPTIAGTIFGALDYLIGFPYGCTEQTLSQFVPNIIVADTLRNVETAKVKDTARLNAMVKRGFKRLYASQNADGGWGWWSGERSNPFMTAYAVDGLTMARAAGYEVENSRLASAREAITKMLADNRSEDDKPYDLETRAYLIYALNKIEPERKFVGELYARRENLQPYGKALLALTLHELNDMQRAREVVGELNRTVRVNDFDAHWESVREKDRFVIPYTEINDVEATALAVKALVRINPENPLLPKAARWLVGNRQRGGRWLTTKQTAFAIYALADYLKISNEQTPDYALEIYVDNEQVLSRQITSEDASKGASFVIERKNNQVKTSNNIRIVKRGAGALYITAQLDYFSREEITIAQSSPDLRLTRDYFRLKIEEREGNPAWAVEPLRGDVRSGDLIVSRLRVTGARGRYLMIEDPIPAGCEQVESTSGLDFDKSAKDWTDWYSGREFRDERTAIFLDNFDGDATYNYVLRVQTPGDFRIAPARAELMYHPTVAANTATGSLKINDR